MSKIEQEALKYGIPRNDLLELLIEETMYPYISLEDAILELIKLKVI